MKRFIISVLCVAVFFIGLGGLIEQVGAKFKSDEQALALIKQARIAIGGEANINSVKSFSAKGKAVRIFNLNGASKSQEGDFEVNLALPNQFSKMVKLRVESNAGEASKSIVEEDNKILVFRKSEDGVTFGGDARNGVPEIITGAEGDKFKREIRVSKGAGEMHGNEMLRTMLGLLASAPEGTDVEYSYVGTGDVDGNSCEIVEAKTANSSVAKIYLSKSSNLPVMISYQGTQMPKVFQMHKDDIKADAPGDKDVKVFVSKLKEPKLAEINIKFSDYRTVNGLQLPFVWTQTANGEPAETITIENYEINPSNIAEKFNQLPHKIMVRTDKKP